MIDLNSVDELLTQLSEMLDPNQTTQNAGERAAGPANTTVGAGPARGAGISGAQHTQHQNQFNSQKSVAGSLGLGDEGTVAGSERVKPSDAGITGYNHTKHTNDFAHYGRMSPSAALGLGKAGRSSGGNLDSAR